MELGDDAVHDSFHLFVAETAYAACVGVVNLLYGLETAGFDVESYFTVGVAERHAVGSQTIDLLDREHKVVARIIENMFVQ